MTGEAHITLWTSGTLRCVLAIAGEPVSHAVHVLDGTRTLRIEPATDADEAARIAERLWKEFVESAT